MFLIIKEHVSQSNNVANWSSMVQRDMLYHKLECNSGFGVFMGFVGNEKNIEYYYICPYSKPMAEWPKKQTYFD